MLVVRDLSFGYGPRAAPVLRGINMELREGEIGVVLGRNGSGKTTLFKCILGICAPQKGSVFFDGSDLAGMSRRERSRTMAYVPQQILFGSLSVFDSVLTGRVSRFGLRADTEDYAAVERLLADMRLEHCAAKNVQQLSGGERQKVAIARALAQEPRLLIFDEPTANLDIANELLINEEAKKLARERNIAVLSSLHDLNQALNFGDRFFFIKNGAIRYSGGPESLTEAVIQEVFDAKVRLIDYQGEKIIMGGTKNER